MRSKGTKPDINVTPLVDVVLVLLIIFMVVVPQMEAGADVKLPSAANVDDKNAAKADPITVSLTSDGRLFLEKDPLSLAELTARLAAHRSSDPDRRVVLRGDEELPYARVRDLFKLCRDLGFPGVALQVGTKDERKGGG